MLRLYGFASGYLRLTGWSVSAACHVAALTAGLFFSGLWTVQQPTSAGSVSVVSLQLQTAQLEQEFEPPDVPIVQAARDEPESIPILDAIDTEIARDQDLAEAVTPPKLPATELAVVTDTAKRGATKPTRPAPTTVAGLGSPVARPVRPVDTRHPMPPVPRVNAIAIGFDETTPARPLENPLPVYPPEAIRRGIVGQLVLRITIAASGKVSRAEVAQTSGFRILDDAAVSAVRQWSFVPAQRGGRPVAWTAKLPVRFRRN